MKSKSKLSELNPSNKIRWLRPNKYDEDHSRTFPRIIVIKLSPSKCNSIIGRNKSMISKHFTQFSGVASVADNFVLN